MSPWQHAGFQTSPILEAFLKVSTVTLVFLHFFSAWQVSKRSEHENYLSRNILKTPLRRFQHTINFFSSLADKCKRCGKFFNQLTDCMKQKTHTAMKSYTCQYCAKSFSNSSGCKQHERTHTGEKPYTCKHCQKPFSTSSECKRHERIHTGEKPYTCKHCKKSFRLSSNCKEHERTHTGEKPYTCKRCQKSFSTSSVCKRHERTHTGEKPYTCKHCEKSFGLSSNCKEHERTHTGEKPYKCKHCKKSFSRLTSCKQHERTHTGERPYTCKHCEKSFTQSSNCKIHEERHARASSLKQKQHDQNLKSRRDLQKSVATLGVKKSCVLSSLTEENSTQVESLTCWICQKEFSSEACVIQHYDEHMRLK